MSGRLSKAEARAVTNRIRAIIDHTLLPLFVQAYRGEADIVLGYDSWVDYCRAELRGLSLPTGLRVKVAQGLRDELGLSNRAIAAALNTSGRQVGRDLAGAANVAPEKVIGRDGRQYPACKPPRTKVEIKRSPLHFAEQASALIAAIDDQHYGPHDLNAEQLRVFGNLRDALEEFAVVFHAEEMAAIQESEQRCP
jgi:hypothetical protein